MGKQLINLGTVANDGTGDGPRGAGGKINSNFNELYAMQRMSAPSVSFWGDSIMDNYGSLSVSSPFYWSLTKYPRIFTSWQNKAISGSRSGPTTGYSGQDISSYPTAYDLNMPGTIAAAIATNSDIMFVESGGNDGSGSLTETYNNIKAFCLGVIAGLPSVKIVLFPSPPQSSRPSAFLVHLERQLQALALAYPANIYCMPIAPLILDDSTSHANIGGTGQGAGSMSDSIGQHPSTTFARLFEPWITALLDQLGVPRTQVQTTSQNDRYSASTLPSGNVWGLMGSMSGSTTSGVGSGCTGNTVTDATSGATIQAACTGNVTAVMSTGAALTYGTKTFRALQAVVTGSALAGLSTWELARNNSIGVTIPALAIQTSLLVEVSGATGLVGLELLVNMTNVSDGQVFKSFKMGGTPASYGGAGMDMVDGLYQYFFPHRNTSGGAQAINMTFKAYFRPGSSPNCTIRLAQLVTVPLPAA